MNELTCGFADGIITPPLRGIFLDGYGFRTTPAESIRDELHAKVMAVGDGEHTVLLFSLDLLALIPRLYKLVSRQIAAITGVPVGRIALNCIHTHSAPVAGGLAEMPIDTGYFAHVGDVCGEIALRAMERRVPGTFRAEILPEKLIHAFCTPSQAKDGRSTNLRSWISCAVLAILFWIAVYELKRSGNNPFMYLNF